MAVNIQYDIYKVANQDIQIDPVDIDKAIELIIDTVSREIDAEYLKVDWKYLQIEAQRFLSSIDAIEKQYTAEYGQQLRQIMYSGNPSVSSLVTGKIRSKKRIMTHAKYLLAERFEHVLDAYRGRWQKRSMLFVHELPNGKVKTYSVSLKDLILNADKNGHIQTKTLYNLIQKEEGATAIEDSKILGQDVLEAGQDAYADVKRRLRNFYEKYGKKAGLPDTVGLLMWKIGKSWTVAKVLNKGDQKEAYASFIFKEKSPITNSIILNRNAGYNQKSFFIKYYYMNYLQKITNLAAIIEEDIALADVEYGVKGDSASLPSLKQYVNTARWLIQNKESNISPDELNFALRSDRILGSDAERNKIMDDIKGVTKDAVAESFIQSYLSLKNKT